jgi:hypothetical protein
LGEPCWFYWAVADLLIEGIRLLWLAVTSVLLSAVGVTGCSVVFWAWFCGLGYWFACLD